jgi:propionyl-CoA synthetase
MTGDAGYYDKDGYLYVMTRTDDVINTAGHRISTGRIEEVLSEHRSVAECAVVGKEDQLKGEVPIAFVIMQYKEDVKKLTKEL